MDIDAMARVMSQHEFLMPTQSGLFGIVQKSRYLHHVIQAESPDLLRDGTRGELRELRAMIEKKSRNCARRDAAKI
ncbi:MAG: hypothetical protein WBF43_13845 [Methylocella sp.]